MFSFKHYSTKSVKQADGSTKSVDLAGEMLEVPTTMAELAALDGDVMVEVTIGVNDAGKRKTISVPQPCADYIVGRKLRSNQDQQRAASGENGKLATRALTQAWYGMTIDRDDLFKRLMAAGTPSGKKAYDAWLDDQYAKNREAIELYAEASK
jgi:hypothetical protein